MKLGMNNPRKTIAAFVLFVFSIALFIRMFSSSSVSNNSGVRAANVEVSQNSPSTRPASRRVRQRTVTTTRKTDTPAQVLPSLDPRLRLNLLRESEETTYAGTGRNIFAMRQPEIEKPKAPPFTRPQITPAVAQLPPPPPPIPLKFFGFASQPGQPKRVFLAQGDDVFVAAQGDIVNRRYKVVRINPASVEIQDVLSNNRQTIPLTQG